MNKKNQNLITITEIKIKLKSGKEITLSSDEARDILTELNKLFLLEADVKKSNELQKLQETFDELKKNQPQYIPCPYPIWIQKEWPQYPAYPSPLWYVDPYLQPTYTSPTATPIEQPTFICSTLSIDLTKSNDAI